MPIAIFDSQVAQVLWDYIPTYTWICNIWHPGGHDEYILRRFMKIHQIVGLSIRRSPIIFSKSRRCRVCKCKPSLLCQQHIYKKNTHPSFFGGLLVPYSKTKTTNSAYECMVTSPSSLQFLEAPDEAGFLQVVNHFAHLRLEYDTSVGTCSVHATRLEHVFGGWIKTRILKGPPHLSFS